MTPSQQFIYQEAERLWKMGLAVHWLFPRSKRPTAPKWTEGRRKEWAELAKTFSPGMNVGIRLGSASKVPAGYLCVVDCDVKGNDPRHRLELQDALRLALPLPPESPKVSTGRGNGSCHIYVATPLPVAPKRLAVSPELIAVKIPSVKASKRDWANLTPEQIGAGYRIRPAWEISLMGEGQQVVAVPSVHPDTEAFYSYEVPLGNPEQITSVGQISEALQVIVEPRPELARNGDFKPVDFDLVSSRLSDEIVDMILTGKGCPNGDRSAGAFKAAIAMYREGYWVDEILTVLTDPDTFLGQMPFDHAQTTSRGKAAAWLRRYTLPRAEKEADVSRDFEKVEVTPNDDDFDDGLGPPLGGAGGGAAAEPDFDDGLGPVDGGEEWKAKLDRVKNADGRPQCSFKNVLLVLENAVGREVFKRNDFSGAELHGCSTPWGAKAEEEVGNTHLILIQKWFANVWRFEPGLDKIQNAIVAIGDQNKFHPVRDYLATLEWDGVLRVDTWLKDFLDATAGSDAYLEAVGRKTLVAMIARVMRPGTKFDHVLILEGKQGVGKSTAVSVLAGDWFSDATINVADKDGVLSMRSAWVVELGELGAMRKADVDTLKEFISRMVDRIRVPYGRRTEAFPRQCIFIGTTNGGEYLRDQTGNRRFWPVEVGACDLVGLRKARDQLLAEALWIYQNTNEKLYLEGDAAALTATEEQDRRTFHDTWVELIEQFVTAKRRAAPSEDVATCGVTTHELFTDGPLATWREDRGNQMRAADALRKLGFIRQRIRQASGKIPWVYLPPGFAL